MNIINCSTSIGQRAFGVSLTPKIIQKNLQKINKFKHVKFTDLTLRNDYINATDFCKYQGTFENARNIYYNNCINLLQKDKINLNIGGDHSISLGSVAASIDKYKDDLFVIWFDAHADINSYEVSKSKNTHGTPLHYLTKSNSYLYESWLHDNQLDYKNLLYIGIRDLDYYEQKIINENKIQNINMNVYKKLNINDPISLNEHFHVLKRIINNKKIHLSIDVDGLDPSYIMCTGTRVSDGIDLHYLLELIKFFRKDIVNVDLTELNLELASTIDDQIKSIKNFLKIIDSIKGE